MKSRIEEVMSRILSRKYDAKIKIRFEGRKDEQRRNNHRTCGDDPDAGERIRQAEEESSAGKTIYRSL